MKKLLAFILCLSLTSVLLACNEVKINSISLVEESIPVMISIDEIDEKIDDIQIKIEKSDSTIETINLSKDMISESDLPKLAKVGNHELTVVYEGAELKINLTISDYSVKVVYPDNTPVTSGVSVQWCTGQNCFLPVAVNSNGIAVKDLEDGEYYIHIDGIPAGYTYDPNAYTTNTNNKNVVIKLLELASITDGDGTAQDPYKVSASAYNISFDEATRKGMKYFSFTAPETATYSIISLAMDKLALNNIDPYIGFLGTSNDLANIDVSGNKDSTVNINFNHTFEAVQGQTYTFIIFVSSADKFPATFDFVITK